MYSTSFTKQVISVLFSPSFCYSFFLFLHYCFSCIVICSSFFMRESSFDMVSEHFDWRALLRHSSHCFFFVLCFCSVVHFLLLHFSICLILQNFLLSSLISKEFLLYWLNMNTETDQSLNVHSPYYLHPS